MPTERTFTVGNRRRRLELFEELAAVRATTPEASELLARGAYGPRADLSELLSGPYAPLTKADAEAFRAAGWFFVQVDPARWEKLSKEPDLRLARVFRDEMGHLVLGTGRVSVKLRADLPEREALATLDRAHVQVIRKLRFSPNLYQVRVPEAADEIETVRKLQDDVRVEAAEPELLEHIERRDDPPASTLGSSR